MGGRRLACGCFTGLYAVGCETLETLDACDPDCPDGHRAGATVAEHVPDAGRARRPWKPRRRARAPLERTADPAARSAGKAQQAAGGETRAAASR